MARQPIEIDRDNMLADACNTATTDQGKAFADVGDRAVVQR
jgi:hypothetical protein